MARTLKCPHCRHKFKVDDDLQGNFSCPSCERTLKISPRKKREPQSNTSDETLPPDHDPDATAAPDFKLDEVQQTLEGESDHGQTISEFMQERGYQGGVELGEGDPGKTKSTEIIEAEDGKKYKVGEMVARGGMGAILEAMDLNIRRSVAMKVMLSKREVEERVVLRFIEEAQITGQLEHPNIVPVHELGVDGSGNVFYTMKLIQGLTLKHILRRIAEGDREIIERFPLMHLINVFLKICDAMSLAHAKGVVHRDLKPENIMVGDFGEVSVLDWGLAKVVGRDERALPEGPSWRRSRRTATLMKSIPGQTSMLLAESFTASSPCGIRWRRTACMPS